MLHAFLIVVGLVAIYHWVKGSEALRTLLRVIGTGLLVFILIEVAIVWWGQ